MASINSNTVCARCPNAEAQTLCIGCETWLCWNHLREHRLELGRELEVIIQDHDGLRDRLTSDDAPEHGLLTRINTWEQRSIDRIRQVADEARRSLNEYLADSTRQSSAFLAQISKEILLRRRNEDYNDSHLNLWKYQLKQIRDRVEHLPAVEIIHDREDMAEKIALLKLQVQHFNHENTGVLTIDSQWRRTGEIVAGGDLSAERIDQLDKPYDLDIDDDGTLLITDQNNHRIVAWKPGARSGETIAGGKGPGSALDQLNQPVAVMLDRRTNTLIISDKGNRRVLRWPRRNGLCGQIILSDIVSLGLALDHEGSLYVSDYEKHEVRCYRQEDRRGIVVAGGSGPGPSVSQLNGPRNIFVDDDQSVYVSDMYNHRVVKWSKNRQNGLLVAGGEGNGSELSQLWSPCGLYVDSNGSLYVADQGNNRIVRWLQAAERGGVIISNAVQQSKQHQLSMPASLTFDRFGHLYVVDRGNQRVQRFMLENRQRMS